MYHPATRETEIFPRFIGTESFPENPVEYGNYGEFSYFH